MAAMGTMPHLIPSALHLDAKHHLPTPLLAAQSTSALSASRAASWAPFLVFSFPKSCWCDGPALGSSPPLAPKMPKPPLVPASRTIFTACQPSSLGGLLTPSSKLPNQKPLREEPRASPSGAPWSTLLSSVPPLQVSLVAPSPSPRSVTGDHIPIT